ncbi:MAG: tetratricopeptide repeat protein [Smithella sp.]
MLNKLNLSLQKQTLIIYIALAVVTLAVYWQVRQFDFVNFDDVVYVKENRHVQSGITLNSVTWAFSTTHAEFWHPLTWLTLMFDYEIYGLKAGGYHVTNLILHILSTLLLFWLFNRMTGAVWRSAFVAAAFALHPLQVEPVAWISQRKDVLSALFGMLTLCLYVRYTENPVIRRYLAVLFTFLLALMSKPMVVTLPAIMILLDFWPLGRFDQRKEGFFRWQFKEKAPFFVLSAVFSVITIYTQSSGKQMPPVSRITGELFYGVTHLGTRISNALVYFVSYLEKIFWPHNLAVFYPFPETFPPLQVAQAALLIFVISAVTFVTVKRRPFLLVGWLWFLIALLPVIGIIRKGFFAISDHYVYLPFIGIAIMTAWGIPSLIPPAEARKKVLFPLTIALLAVLIFLTWQQCACWKNSFELFNHTALVTKDNYLAYTNRGNANVLLGRYQQAIEDCTKALKIKPDYSYAYFNRGFAYAKLEQYQRAIEDLSHGIRLKPDDGSGYFNRGNAYGKLGQYKRAVEDYNLGIRLKPDRAEGYANRGDAYGELKQYQQAIENYNTAIRLKPDYAEAYYHRGHAYYRLGQKSHALKDYNEAIRLKPDFAGVYYVNRGNVYEELGGYQQAIENYNQAIRLKPDDAEAYYNRGNVYYRSGRYQQAIEDYNKSIQIKPDNDRAYYNRGNAYMKFDQYQSAIQDYNKASQLNPQNVKAHNNRGIAYYKLKQQSLAIKEYNQAIRLQPDYAEAYFNRGNAYTELGQYQAAITNYTESIRLKQDYVQAYGNRANAFFITGETALGCRDAKKACEMGTCVALQTAESKGFCR